MPGIQGLAEGCDLAGGAGELGEGISLLAFGQDGLKAARDKGWLKDGRLSAEGAAAFGELLVHELVERAAPPVARAPGEVPADSPPG